jgi:hypothetical protein
MMMSDLAGQQRREQPYPGAPPPLPDDGHRGWSKRESAAVTLKRWLYHGNPFYLVSAALVLLGLNLAFGASADTADPWMLLQLFVGYTIVIAAAGFVVVRLGKVWDDGRSILLVVALLFLAISVSFDELINEEAVAHQSASGVALLCCGFAFAAAMSELLLWLLNIRLPLLFRAPYHGILGLFFGYPLLLRWLMTREGDSAVLLGIYFFTSAAALLFLLLIPAVRKGAAYVRDNGTPWSWPWFPWLLFGLLGLAVCVRSYYLTLSFHGLVGMDSIFGLYFLTPFLLAVGVIVLEMGIVSRRRWVQVVALALPALAVVVSFPGDSGGPVAVEFVQLLTSSVTSPALLAVAAALLFCAYAVARRVPMAMCGVLAALAMLTVVGPTTHSLASLVRPQTVPLITLGALIGWLAIRTRQSLYVLGAAAFVLTVTTIALADTPFVMYSGVIPVTLLYLTTLAVGWLSRDRFMIGIRHAAAACHMLMALYLLAVLPDSVAWAALLAVSVVPFVYARRTRGLAHFYAGLFNLTFTLGYFVVHGIIRLNARIETDVLVLLLCSALSFCVAFIISLVKVPGLFRRLAGGVSSFFGTAGAGPDPLATGHYGSDTEGGDAVAPRG